MKIAHLADIHFGKIAFSDIVPALLEDVRSCRPDLVVVAGDLTQRARLKEYRKAAAMLQAFALPVLVVPGNHDVYPWWFPLHRLCFSLGRYRKFITNDLSPTWEKDGVAVLGINSASGWMIQRGWCTGAERTRIHHFFSSRPPEDFCILVVHHPLTTMQDCCARDVALGGKQTLRAAAYAGVDLILCGHWHLSYTGMCSDDMVIGVTGTVTSNRWRLPQHECNQYHVLEILSDHFLVRERRYNVREKRYAEVRHHRFERTGALVTADGESTSQKTTLTERANQ